jgi:hypothetical protein
LIESSNALQFQTQADQAVTKPTSIFQMGPALPALLEAGGANESLTLCFSHQLFLSPAVHKVVVVVQYRVAPKI